MASSNAMGHPSRCQGDDRHLGNLPRHPTTSIWACLSRVNPGVRDPTIRRVFGNGSAFECLDHQKAMFGEMMVDLAAPIRRRIETLLSEYLACGIVSIDFDRPLGAP